MLLLLSGLFFSFEQTDARELGESQVRSAVETWVRHVTADARSDAIIERMEPYAVDGQTAAYIAHLLGGGFCLCGADDVVLPVYFYSPSGIYDDTNPGLEYILWEIETRTKYLRDGLRKGDADVLQSQTALNERASYWQELIAGSIPRKLDRSEPTLAEPDSMSLGLTCPWGQGSPYNDLCPILTPGMDEHCLVGCTATAMSQIMYYWKWPHGGDGTGSTTYKYRFRNDWDEAPLADSVSIPASWAGRLEWTAANDGRLRMNGYWDATLYRSARSLSNQADYLTALENLWNNLTTASTICTANFGSAAYDWSLVQDSHADPVDPGDEEVAEISYHAAVSIDTKFGVRGSSSMLLDIFGSDVGKALKDHFRYDDDVVWWYRDINTMTEEIQWLRPLELRGQRPDSVGGGGHAWVVHGYNKGTDPDRQFEMNLGWGGASNGWYSCDNITDPVNFNESQQHTTRIAPEGVVKFVGAGGSGDGSPYNPYRDIEEALSEAASGTTLIFKAGSENTFSSASLVIDLACTLKGKDVLIRKQ